MSKLDQLKALGDAKRAARNSSDGSVESRHAATAVSPLVGSTGAGKVVRSISRSVGVTPNPSETKRGRGRPKVEGPRPWEVQGISKTSYYRYRRQAEKK